MLVCHCRAVNERTVNRAIDRGADTLDAVGRSCGAGTHCGGYHPEIERLSERASRPGGAGASHGLVPAFRLEARVRHAEWLETQLGLIRQLGDTAYLAEQLGGGTA